MKRVIKNVLLIVGLLLVIGITAFTMYYAKTNLSVSLTNIYYVIFGIESLVILMIVLYLVLSLFNKKTFIETFSGKNRIIIYIMVNVILAILLTVGTTIFTNKVLLVN